MPPRKSHKKSKAGCQRCKQRRVKCNEVHPRCGNCEKHGISCDFEAAPSALYQFSAARSFLGSSPGSLIAPFYQPHSNFMTTSSYPQTTRPLELRLMHHYSTQTCLTIAAGSNLLDVFQNSIPSLAYDAQYLMDTILAVSALHLRTLCPEDKSLVRASHGYMVSALAQYASLLNSGVSESNAEAFFATSILITFHASASRLFMNKDRELGSGHKGYILPLAWFHSFQGTKALSIASFQYVLSSRHVLQVISTQPTFPLDLNPERSGFFGFLLEGVDKQLENIEKSLHKNTRKAYEHAVAYLNLAHQNPERLWIMTFAGSVSGRFVELLGQYDPRTLVIVACFFAMTRAVDDIWWLQGVAKREVMGVMSVLPEEWYPKMDWAVRVANTEEQLDKNVWGASG